MKIGEFAKKHQVRFAVVGSMAIMLFLLLNVFDRASFPLLYKKADE